MKLLRSGKRLYEANCQNCHMEDGSGLNNLSRHYHNHPFGTCIDGMHHSIRQRYGHLSIRHLLKEMPNHKSLSATEIANIVNYVNKSSGFQILKNFVY